MGENNMIPCCLLDITVLQVEYTSIYLDSSYKKYLYG